MPRELDEATPPAEELDGRMLLVLEKPDETVLLDEESLEGNPQGTCLTHEPTPHNPASHDPPVSKQQSSGSEHVIAAHVQSLCKLRVHENPLGQPPPVGAQEVCELDEERKLEEDTLEL